jgi:hypothetical protein
MNDIGTIQKTFEDPKIDLSQYLGIYNKLYDIPRTNFDIVDEELYDEYILCVNQYLELI